MCCATLDTEAIGSCRLPAASCGVVGFKGNNGDGSSKIILEVPCRPMANRANSSQLSLPPKRRRVPAYRWLYSSLRDEILCGLLRPGLRLPSSRDLARQFGLARGSFIKAFDQLKSEGYVDGILGSGTYVGEVLPESLLHITAKRVPKAIPPPTPQPTVSHYGKRAIFFPGYENRPVRAFRGNLPALDLFPIALWSKINVRCLRRISTRNLIGCDPLGYFPLRRAVTDYLTSSRGVRCGPEQVAIVSGVQEALDVTGRLLLNPGDRVCVENPGYPGAVLVFQALGAKVSTARIDDQGIRTDQLPAHDVRLIYVTPGHQFPLGTTMSLARRLQLLQWARKSGAVILEDDYDSEYRYSGRPIPALQGLDQSALVLYAGSFSKVLFPALRLGYVVIPPGLVHQFEAIQSLGVRHAPLLEQFVLTEFIAEGHFGRHLRRMRQIYAERLSVLMEESSAKLHGLLEISKIEAGLQTTGWLRNGLDAEDVARTAAKRGVDLTPLGRYTQGPALRKGLQLGFAALELPEIRRGVRDLAITLEYDRKLKRAKQ